MTLEIVEIGIIGHFRLRNSDGLNLISSNFLSKNFSILFIKFSNRQTTGNIRPKTGKYAFLRDFPPIDRLLCCVVCCQSRIILPLKKFFLHLWRIVQFFLKSILRPKAEKLTHRGKRDCLTVLACCGIIKNLKVFGVSYLLAEKLTFNLTSRNLHSLAFPSILIIIITWPKMRKKSKSANFERRPQTPSRK